LGIEINPEPRNHMEIALLVLTAVIVVIAVIALVIAAVQLGVTLKRD
jgi:hypothetical protein